MEQHSKDQFLLQTIKYLKEQKRSEFLQMIDELQPYDIAELYRELPEKHHYKFLMFLLPKQVAILLQELDRNMQLEILHKLGVEKSSQVMNMMENDDLVDLLNNLSVEKIEEFLSLMKKTDSETVQTLMKYPAETAGGIMTNRYVWTRRYYTVQETIAKLRSFATLAENLYYIYVLDDEKKLVGVVSYRDLLLAEPNLPISEIMYNRVISVHHSEDQEKVASIIEKYDFIAVPVVDDDHHLIGIITVDDVIDVVIREANEDIEKLSASGTIDFQTGPITASARRLPWLILLLFLGLVSGSIISGFEDVLHQVVTLAFFMPMIAGMTGNTGTQSLAVVVRGLVSHDINKRLIYRLILRELMVGLIIGTVCGTTISLIAYFWQGDPILGLIVGGSLFLTLIIGTMAGTIIPIILYHLRIDPAVASGPLITTLNDVFSLLIYFGMASMFLHYLT